jgi:hypothetical protein
VPHKVNKGDLHPVRWALSATMQQCFFSRNKSAPATSQTDMVLEKHFVARKTQELVSISFSLLSVYKSRRSLIVKEEYCVYFF